MKKLLFLNYIYILFQVTNDEVGITTVMKRLWFPLVDNLTGVTNDVGSTSCSDGLALVTDKTTARRSPGTQQALQHNLQATNSGTRSNPRQRLRG